MDERGRRDKQRPQEDRSFASVGQLPVRVRRLRDLAHRAAEIVWAMAMVQRPIRRGPRHGLDRELVVSLTSYPRRFPTLHLTLRSLLSQSVSPDRLVLWIAHDDFAKLPPKVTNLVPRGLKIRGCEDLRSFKKIVPALKAFPEAYIVTADDDVYYPRRWLKGLVDAAMPGTSDIVAHTVRRPVYVESALAPIETWEMNAVDSATQRASDDLFPVGVAGTLYPPSAFHPEVSDSEVFTKLCPTCDDSWFAWMARRQGTLVRRSASPKWTRFIAWSGTNAGSLAAENFAISGDALMQDTIQRRLSDHFGPLNRLKR